MLEIKKARSETTFNATNILIGAGIALFAALCARTSLFGFINPYGLALIAAAMASKTKELPIALGVAAGLCTLLPDTLADMAVTFVCVCGLYGIRLLQRRLNVVSVMSVMLLLFVTLPFRSTTPYGYLTGAAEILLGALSFFVFRTTIVMAGAREAGMPTEDKKICLLLALCIALLGSGSLVAEIFSAPMFLGLIVVMGFGLAASVGGGACAGIAVGSVLLHVGYGVETLGFFAAFGLLCGVFSVFTRAGMTLMLLGANGISILLFSGFVFPYPELLLACAVILLIPNAAWRYCRQFYSPAVKKVRTGVLYGMRMRDVVSARLQGCSRAFCHMAEAIAVRHQQDEKKARLAMDLANEICTGCERANECWQDRFMHTHAAFERLAGLCVGDEMSEPEWFNKSCRRYELVKKEMSERIGDEELFALKRQVVQAKGLAHDQLLHVSAIMDRLACEETPVVFDEELEQCLMERFEEENLRVYGVNVENYMELIVEVKIRNADEKLVERIVSEVCETNMVVVDRRTGKSCRKMVLKEKLRFRMESGCEQVCAQGGKVCGDSVNMLRLGDTKYILMISDGMGIGENAASESRATIEMLQDLVCAGYDEAFILDVVNRLLILKGEDTYSTVDMCVIDATNGSARFIKVGGAPSYIYYDGVIDKVNTAALPIGILEQVSPTVTERALLGNEYIVMMSDGIYDVVGDRLAEWIKSASGKSSGGVAKELMKRAQEMGVSDDATVVVGQIRPL
ncbi:MAG: SpoIIE family protein phosphatase [Christensenellales bacterium]